MVVSDPLAAFERDGMVKLVSPAKVNLYLDIGAKRSDGYHEVVTVMHSLALHDILHMDIEATSEGGLQIEVLCYAREGLESLAIPSEENIAYKAISLLAQKIGRTENERITVRIEKHIPHEAGLGGGSSNAAAALVGAAALWGIDERAPELLEAAGELGADVAFFLFGGCACLTGTGEVFDHALEPMKKTAVLVKPEGGVSTSAAYAAFDRSPVLIDSETRNAALVAKHAEEVPLANNLVAASKSLMPELADLLSWLAQQSGVEKSLMSGSGSSAFAVCATFDDACRIVAAARNRGWWARTTAFSSARAMALPR
ncbi:4-(cytidine 5'-diphospho)-2-C-methyl-D-erythritol kinase [Raoultibacter phocaeensis]|uniref:4-(cytidine 5'-diphospho)-2-C-methyl-D-erythritol kinase n=1 Tax=Raoultibacter phocaeensis TaxID=2479841 RepID=UPI001119D13B|nr:4-(cytidine 5'-diphospho)-2-C-methyl-D-erythritol kinase [Raoultibacter phocaeensis]